VTAFNFCATLRADAPAARAWGKKRRVQSALLDADEHRFRFAAELPREGLASFAVLVVDVRDRELEDAAEKVASLLAL
jgi:hypothetical protein